MTNIIMYSVSNFSTLLYFFILGFRCHHSLKKRETWDDIPCHHDDIKEHNPPTNFKSVIVKKWDDINALLIPPIS